MPTESANSVFKKTYQGLTSAEAILILKEFGPNILKPAKESGWLIRLAKEFFEPMIIMLFMAAVVYYFLGDRLESLILFLSAIPIVSIEFFQRQKTDKAIKALDKLITTYCMVYRDGEVVKMETKNLVPGDLVYLTAGDKVSADGYLINSPGLSIDESMLTGESMAVTKSEAGSTILEQNKLYQGTLVVQGEGRMVVQNTGDKTEYGRLGKLLVNISDKKTPLQNKIYNLVKFVALAGILVAVIITVVLSFKYGLGRGILAGLTMAISLIPEEFPIVFSVFIIMGVQHIAKEKALVRDSLMIETLGSATVIGVDKTGTLTEGRMSLEKIYYGGLLHNVKKISDKNDFKNLIYSALFSLEQIAVDPIEIELQSFARKNGIDVEKIYKQSFLVKESPFDAKTKIVNHLWRDKKGNFVQYSAGAPETIIKYSKLSASELKKAEQALEKLSGDGYRVIAVADRKCSGGEKIILEDLEFRGLLAMSDPPKAGVKEAIDVCQKAGIRIIMITGDNKLTAHNVAEQINLKHNEEIFDGDGLDKLSPEALGEVVKRHDIFARIRPEQKYLIVEALQKAGEIVAMTGDGVNDSPALKKANIGIAMGQKGTEVARAAAGIILLDDNFATIVNAIKEGRRIYDNLRHSFSFLFSFHLPIVGLAFLPLFFGGPLIFSPIHIIFLELICDPASVLGFEKERPRRGLMLEPPRPVNEPLVNPALWGKIIGQGLGILLVSFGLYYRFAVLDGNVALGRTLAFGSLVVAQIFMIFFSREWHQIKSNFLLIFISILTFSFLVLAILNPGLRSIFYFVEISKAQWLWMILLPLGVGVFLRLILGKRGDARA